MAGDGVSRRHHRSPAVATSRRGRIRGRPMAFNVAATVTLSSYRNASLFWIMLWLVSGPGDHGMIPVGLHAEQQLGCQLCPQLRVYCCIAASEVMGQKPT